MTSPSLARVRTSSRFSGSPVLRFRPACAPSRYARRQSFNSEAGTWISRLTSPRSSLRRKPEYDLGLPTGTPPLRKLVTPASERSLPILRFHHPPSRFWTPSNCAQAGVRRNRMRYTPSGQSVTTRTRFCGGRGTTAGAGEVKSVKSSAEDRRSSGSAVASERNAEGARLRRPRHTLARL